MSLRLENRPTSRSVKKRRAKAVKIAAKIFLRAHEPLRRNIIGRAPDLPARLSVLSGQHGETEINDLSSIAIGKKDIARFDVAVDQAGAQGRAQALRDLQANFERLPLRKLFLILHAIVETAAADQLHDDIKLPMIFADRIDLDHMRMFDRGRDARFFLQLGRRVGVVRKLFAEELESDESIEPCIARLEHGAHPACAKWFDHFVVLVDSLHPQRLTACRASQFGKWLQPDRRHRVSTSRARLHLRGFLARTHCRTVTSRAVGANRSHWQDASIFVRAGRFFVTRSSSRPR